VARRCSDALRAVVQQARRIRDALAELNEHARTNLKAGVHHPTSASRSAATSAPRLRLAAAQAEQPLTKDWITTWNKKAQELIKRLIEQPQPPAHHRRLRRRLSRPSPTAEGLARCSEGALNPADA
jgi:HPt (histidine-containing phosphotransfer) domain-containing protein